MVIGFETETYEASEGQRQELCVAILEGVLESPVEVTLSTEDGTASGEANAVVSALGIVYSMIVCVGESHALLEVDVATVCFCLQLLVTIPVAIFRLYLLRRLTRCVCISRLPMMQ